MVIRLLSPFILLFCLSIQLHAENDSGKRLLLLGNSTPLIGRGGAGNSLSGSDLFFLNPAAIGDLERVEFGLHYGSLDFELYSPDVSLAVPTSYGVFGMNFRMLKIPDTGSRDLTDGYLFNTGGAKHFTDKLIIGSALNIFAGADLTRNSGYVGLLLGGIYRTGFSWKIGKGFMLYDPGIGLSVNAGIPFGRDKRTADFNQATFGYDFIFFKNHIFNIRIANDVSAINTYSGFPVKFGMESIIKEKYVIRSGFSIPQSYDYNDFSFGLGYILDFRNIVAEINYSLSHYHRYDFIHYAGFNLKYGKPDREPPVTNIRPSVIYISPNFDGRQDYLVFKTEVEDKSRIKGWKLQILNSDREAVREYRVSERDIDRKFTLKDFFKKIWQKKESLIIPESIMWDGADKDRKTVPDGKYSYSLIVWDERDNISVEKTGDVFVDNTSPDVSLVTDDLFSPNSDNNKDVLEIKLTIKSSDEDEWNAGFIDKDGKIIKSYKWTGRALPAAIIWDGRDDSGNEAPEGLYTYFIESADPAGNSIRKEKKEISLTRKYQIADIRCSHEYFSYENHRNLIFYPFLSESSGLEIWSVVIMNEDGRVLKEMPVLSDTISPVNWNALDEKGGKLPDGNYYFKLNARFNSGNAPESFKKMLIFDGTRPEAGLAFSPVIFSPDDDGENDVLTIFPEAKDKNGIKDWKLEIFNQSEILFKSFSGNSVPGIINWDGTGNDKDIVESAADYYLVLTARDPAGNTVKTDRKKLPVDILVVVTERGLKIRISNIEFAFAKSELTEKAFPILNRVVEILGKYSKYSVLIEGHTDDAGEEVYNLKLSEERAKKVMDYLVSKGISEQRLSFRGMGETSPFLPNTSQENRRRNRRVEFLLIKDTEDQSNY